MHSLPGDREMGKDKLSLEKKRSTNFSDAKL